MSTVGHYELSGEAALMAGSGTLWLYCSAGSVIDSFRLVDWSHIPIIVIISNWRLCEVRMIVVQLKKLD